MKVNQLIEGLCAEHRESEDRRTWLITASLLTLMDEDETLEERLEMAMMELAAWNPQA